MKPSEAAKKYKHIRNLKQIARMTGKSSQTLINWYHDSPELFDLVCLGCSAKIENDF